MFFKLKVEGLLELRADSLYVKQNLKDEKSITNEFNLSVELPSNYTTYEFSQSDLKVSNIDYSDCLDGSKQTIITADLKAELAIEDTDWSTIDVVEEIFKSASISIDSNIPVSIEEPVILIEE